MWKSILLHAAPETVPGAANSAMYAASLAATSKGELTGLAFAFKVPTPFGLRTGVDKSTIEKHQNALTESAHNCIAAARELARKAEVEFDEIIEERLAVAAPSIFASYARLHDVTVLSAGHDGSSENYGLIEAAIFESGRPVMLVPETGVNTFKNETVAIAWNDTAQSARALREAMPLLASSKNVHIIRVTDEERLAASIPSIDVAKYLAHHGIQATVSDTTSGEKGVYDALIEKAVGVDAQILVMGAYGHSRLREQILGGATRAVIESCPLAVLMAH